MVNTRRSLREGSVDENQSTRSYGRNSSPSHIMRQDDITRDHEPSDQQDIISLGHEASGEKGDIITREEMRLMMTEVMSVKTMMAEIRESLRTANKSEDLVEVKKKVDMV